jgi:hypothetical protein
MLINFFWNSKFMIIPHHCLPFWHIHAMKARDLILAHKEEVDDQEHASFGFSLAFFAHGIQVTRKCRLIKKSLLCGRSCFWIANLLGAPFR